jgi:hypothetical protein
LTPKARWHGSILAVFCGLQIGACARQKSK